MTLLALINRFNSPIGSQYNQIFGLSLSHDNTNFIKYLTIFGWSKSPSPALFSITIAGYCSIKRLVLENLSSPNFGHLLNAIGITNHSDSSGCLANNDIISLKSAHNRYIVAESNDDVNTNRSAIGSWEKFKLVIK